MLKKLFDLDNPLYQKYYSNMLEVASSVEDKAMLVQMSKKLVSQVEGANKAKDEQSSGSLFLMDPL